MSERPTPETDAAYKYWPCENVELVDADFARKLERERDELIEHLESEKITRNAVIEKLGTAIKERDEAREALRGILRIVESFRYSTALGKSQLERFETAKRLLESAK